MSFLKHKQQIKRCPKTGKIIPSTGKHRWLLWLFPLTGLAALIWFLVRVIPKPSRATYPCQRVAFPLASGFIIWLLGIIGSAVAYRKAKAALARARYVTAAVCIAVSMGFIWAAMSSTGQKPVYAHEPIVANSPLGEGKGVYPGRVVWIHDPNAIDWNGLGDGYWWESDHTLQPVVDEMLSKTLRALSGKGSDYAAWDAIFRYFNQQNGKGYVGYQPGEKIMIKVNFVGFIELWGGCPYNKLTNYPNTSPQVIHAMLDQLVNIAEVNESDITVGDTLCRFADCFYDILHNDFPNVNYLETDSNHVGGSGRVAAQFSSVPGYWSDSNSVGKKQDYVPVSYANAEYLINIANLKGHYNVAGITVCAKNHFGSLLRRPDAPDDEYYDLHSKMLVYDIGHYRPLVDLMGNPHIGGKTLLCLIDGLYAGKHPIVGYPLKWYTDPFDGDWPSSLFASQDQVAIDSVAYDFLLNEWGDDDPGPGESGTDDYLHEAALIPDPCSGTNYDPNDDGGLTESLGVHEHWNNATDKQYSRNLDPINGTGIQLVTGLYTMGDFEPNGDVDSEDFAVFAAAWRSQPGDGNWNAACDISESIDGVIDEYDLIVFCENWLN